MGQAPQMAKHAELSGKSVFVTGGYGAGIVAPYTQRKAGVAFDVAAGQAAVALAPKLAAAGFPTLLLPYCRPRRTGACPQ